MVKVIVDDDGITNRMSLRKSKLIPWSEIGAVVVYRVKDYIPKKDVYKIVMIIDPVDWTEYESEEAQRKGPKWFHPYRVTPPCRFEFPVKGMDLDALRAAIDQHGKLYEMEEDEGEE